MSLLPGGQPQEDRKHMADMISNTRVGFVNLKDSARAHIGNVVHNHQVEDRCLSDLRVTDPRHDKARIEATKGGLIENSYRWILEHSDFRQWRDDERSRLLWIKGEPGKGKTMLLCGIVNELAPHTKLKDQKANGLLSYFFCQAADERINSATAVLRGLIYLMVEQQPSLVSHIQRKYEHGGKAIFKDVNAWSALSEIFLDILEDKSLQQTCVIIDALDECVTDLPMLLDFINTTSTLYSHIKWIVSSRNWPDIEERLDPATPQMRLCLELNANSVSAAVNAYIEHQVNQLAKKKKYSNETKDAVHRHLSSNSNDTFLWVALVCQNLEKTSLQNPLQRLKRFPPGLDALYGRMMEQILHFEDISDTQICCRILEIVLLVYRPLTLAELGSLTGLPYDDDTSIHKAIGFCGSFLTVRDRRVYIIHQSAKDYLSDKALSTSILSNPADVHDVILSRSIQAMSIILRRNIYNLHSPGLSISEIKAPDPDPLSPIRYSCIHWVDHFCDMHSGNSQFHNRLDDEKCHMVILFLRECLLYWLEALGLMGHVGDVFLSMVRLEDLLRIKSPDSQSPDHQLKELIQDSQRFIRQNSSLIANSPLQVYASALIFSPLNSLIRKMFQDKEPQWLKMKPIVQHSWGPYLQTLKGHTGPILSVTFSADGRYLASGSGDGTTKIWDAVTGSERQTLKGHSGFVRSVAFSTDGRYLASGSDNETIKIWDLATGKEIRTFQTHGYLIYSVAFSADGGCLALGLNDKTIKIWDVITGKERQTLQGHRSAAYPITFSADGRYLASGSWDGTIKMWDTITGEERQTFYGHTLWVCFIAVSADGHYLASASIDGTIKIWDIITGKERQTVKGHGRVPSPVAFLADSRYLASVLRGETIKIWDTTNKEQQTLNGHTDAVPSITFSADGRCLASGSLDKTIKIWDTTTGNERHTLKGHTKAVESVAFSADGRYLASGSMDKTIKIWDTTTGKEKQTLNVGTVVYTISLDDTASYLHTNIGLIKLGVRHGTEAQSAAIAEVQSADWNLAHDQDQRQLIANNIQEANHVGYGLSSDKCWITWHEHNILWLPPEYQSSTMKIWSNAPLSTSAEGPPTDVALALGTYSGRVVIIRMPSSGPYPLV